jgi:hypothetical protein
MKKEYESSRIHGKCSSNDEKLTQKIERVLRAWHRACFIETVLAARRSAGFVSEWNGGSIQRIRVNPTLLASKVTT